MSDNDDKKDWKEGLEPEARMFAENLEARITELKEGLVRAKQERDEYRDRRTDAARVFSAIAVIAMTFIVAGAYLVITTDANDHQNRCPDSPQFSAVNGTGQHISISDDCEYDSDSGATIALGYSMFVSGVLMTSVSIVKALSKLRD